MKTCPWCGPKQGWRQWISCANWQDIDYHVGCICGACGPNAPTEAEAVNLWNNRPPNKKLQMDACCENPNLAWNYNGTKWKCVSCAKKGTTEL